MHSAVRLALAPVLPTGRLFARSIPHGADGQAPLAAPLSLAQERLWFLEQFAPGTATYNTPIVLDITGPVDSAVLTRALGEIVQRHEPLRTLFRNDHGRPIQVVQPHQAFVLPFEDLRGDRSCEEFVNQRINDEVRGPVDLQRGPIFRGRLLRVGEEQHVLALVVHHLAFDGWSMGVFLRELSVLYAAFAAGEPSPLPPVPIRYAHIAELERQRQASPQSAQQLDYWRKHLEAPLPTLTLPTDRPRPGVQTSRGQSHDAKVPAAVMTRLQDLGRSSGATPFMTMAALYAVFLSRLAHQRDVIIGTALANRARRELYPLIGFFANTLPMRIGIAPDMTIRDVIASARVVAMNAFDNQQVPLARIVEAVNPQRDLSRSPIFQTLFTFNNTPHSDDNGTTAGPVTMRRRFVSTGTAKADLTLMMPHGAAGHVIFETNSDLFDAATGARMLSEFCGLLAAIPDHIDSPVHQLPVANAPKVKTRPGSGAASPYPRDETVAHLFEAQALRTPDAPAVAGGMVTLTYRELNEQANRLAHVLVGRSRDSRNDAVPFVVGVCLDRSLEAVVALLAILKAGGAYVPLDPSSPPARLAALTERAHLRLIITRDGLADRVADTGAELIVLEREVSAITAAPVTNLDVVQQAETLAYVLFTSGTTGTPKPVGVPHRAIVRLAFGLPSIPLGAGQTVLHASPMSFDAATFELWGPLLHGGCVAIAPPLMLGAAALEPTIAAHHVTVMWLTSSLFNAIVDERVEVLAPVRYLLTGGEKLSVPHVARAKAALVSTRLFNGYGPTEATTFTTCHEIVASDISNPAGIPIGKPLLNTHVYVLDESGSPVETGTPGELSIGGDGLASGYLDDADLTATRFVPDPFAAATGARMFKTGDRARLLPDGTVEFLGRLDDQIKLRGFRIEPGEVEAAIGKHDDVAQCAVVAVDSTTAGRMLVAFYVPAPNSIDADSSRHIREFLRASLPEYMIPSRWIRQSRLPLLNTGKIDRQALKARACDDLDAHVESTPPHIVTGSDQAITAIWREVLAVGEAGPHDNFFDSGGHSLLAVQFLSKIEAAFGVAIGVRALFEAPTLAGISQAVARLSSAGANVVRCTNDDATPRVTAAPQRALDFRMPQRRASSTSPAEVTAGLMDIWRELLGTQAITITGNFFELGGHSLMATRLAAAIEQRFGIDLPLSALFTHGTIEAQTRLLVQAMPLDDWTPIVPIQPHGSERPLFLVHGIGGEVISFQPLASHLDGIPVYGIEADRRADTLEALSVEQVAATYTAAIMRVDPDGPYRIGGYSAGGLIALEIAQQLQRAGRSVSSLVMLDAPAKVTREVSLHPLDVARFIGNRCYWFVDDDYLRSGWDALRQRILQQIRRVQHRLSSHGDGHAIDVRDRMGLWQMPASMVSFVERLSRMLRAYQPQPYTGAMIVITARTHSLFFTMAKDLGWKPLAVGGLTTRVVPGAHDTILREPRVGALAAILRETLESPALDELRCDTPSASAVSRSGDSWSAVAFRRPPPA